MLVAVILIPEAERRLLCLDLHAKGDPALIDRVSVIPLSQLRSVFKHLQAFPDS